MKRLSLTDVQLNAALRVFELLRWFLPHGLLEETRKTQKRPQRSPKHEATEA